MTSQPDKQTIEIHILNNISRSKDNQAMKFAQLIEYNMENIFIEKSYEDYRNILKLSSRPLFISYKAFLEN